MKAAVIHAYGGPEQLKLEDVPDPVAGSGEVLVRVAATSINPFDLKIRSGAVKEWMPLTFPAVLGLDVSGVIEAVGPDVCAFATGDRVFAHTMQTYASRCVVKASDLAKSPEHMNEIELAALPTVTTTGAQLAQLATGGKPRGTVLVTGAVGSVGRSAVFVAKDKGWRVLAGVRNKQIDAANELGTDSVVPLDNENALSSLEPLDAVADTVSGPIADRLIGKIKPGGIFASVLASPTNSAEFPSVRAEAMQVKPDPESLVRMANAVKAGKLVIRLGQRFALAEADKAHTAAEKGAAGKLLIIP